MEDSTMPMSKAEAGRLGALKTKEILNKNKQTKIEEYNKNPTRCRACEKSLIFSKRKNKFCSNSCAAKVTNTLRDKKQKKTCLFCQKELTHGGKYCNNKCQIEKLYLDKIEKWKNNSITPQNSIRRYLKEKYGYFCSLCGISEWKEKPITLEIEHKDGNSLNNLEENLCFLCPNCHSQTNTYKGKNRGNGRHSRRIRYAEGKSY